MRVEAWGGAAGGEDEGIFSQGKDRLRWDGTGDDGGGGWMGVVAVPPGSVYEG